MWANFMRDKLVVGWTAAKSNLLLKVDPLSTICNNKLNTQGEKLETAKLIDEGFCIEYIVASFS